MARPGSFTSWLSDLIGNKAPSSDASSPPAGNAEAGSLSQIELQLMERGQARPDNDTRFELRLQPIVDDGRANGQYLDEPFRLAQAEVGKKITTKHLVIDPARKVFILPEGTSIDDINVDGRNLVLRQPDGTEITLDNAVTKEGTALKVVGIIVGGVEIPAATLAAALGISDVQIAAGESGARGSGANLAAAEGDIGDPFAITPLLPPTELVFDRPTFDEILPPGVEKDNGLKVVQNPLLTVVKTADEGQLADVAGEKLTYTITVQNTGNVALTNIVVSDPNADAGSTVRIADVVGNNDNLLDVGEIWRYTALHTVTQAEIDSNGGGDGKLENVVTVTSDETPATSADATVDVAQTISVAIDKVLLNGGDTLTGLGGADNLSGGSGNNVLVGGTGADTLTGGSGADTFVIDPSHLSGSPDDLIADFGNGADVLDLSDLLDPLFADPVSLADAQASVSFDTASSAGNTIVRIDDNGTAPGGTAQAVVTLQGVSISSALELFDDSQPTAVIS